MENKDRGTKLMGLAALISAAVASICCLGPLIVTGLGLSSLGLAAGFVRYRPIFLGLTSVALAIGFYMAYRKRPVACKDGRCELRSGSKTMKTALWVITVLAGTMAAFPNWSIWILARNHAMAPAGAKALSLRVLGMDCAVCTVAIRKSVEKVPGVLSSNIDFDSQRATVITDGKADPEAVIRAVAAAGYKAELLVGRPYGKPRS